MDTEDGSVPATHPTQPRHYQTGGNHAAAPISYAVDGRQYVALTAGNVLYSFALPDKNF